MTPAALDITIAIILLLSALVAYFRGIIREAFTIVALVVAAGTTYFGGEMMIPLFNKWLKVDQRGEEAAAAVSKAAASGTDAAIAKTNLVMGLISPEKASIICSYASVFVFFYLVMTLVGYFASRAVNEAGLGIVDRLLGAGFGLARGFLVVFLCFLPVSFMFDHDKFPDWAKHSVSVPILEQSVAFVDEKIDLKKLIADSGNTVIEKVNKYKRPPLEKTVAPPEVSPAAGDEEGDLQEELLRDERVARPQ